MERDAAGASSGADLGKLKLQGSAGVFRLDLQGDAGGSAWRRPIWRSSAEQDRLTGLVDASDGGALVDMLGLDRLVTVNQRSGRLALALSGPSDGDRRQRPTARRGLDVSANEPASTGDGDRRRRSRSSRRRDVVPLRSATIGRTSQPPWSTLTARLLLADGAYTLADFDGTLQGSGQGPARHRVSERCR